MSKINNIRSILIIGFVWPEPNSSGAGTRVLQLIDVFQQQGWHVTFASAAADSDFMFNLPSIGVEKVPIAINDSGFDDFVKALDPAIVMFDRFVVEEQFGWRVAENCPNALRLLDTIDLHCLRIARQKMVKWDAKYNDALYSDTAKREIASIFRCDLSLMISETEMELLQAEFKVDKSLLYYLPFLVDRISENDMTSWPAFEDRSDFVFIGNFLHEPNWDAVLHLKNAVWPLIKKRLPLVSMRVYGAYVSQKVLQLHNPGERFLIMGRAQNAADVVRQARIVLAPVRFGAGAKTKLLEAMQCGTPSVTTPIGAESMHGEMPWSGAIAEEPQQLADAAVALYNDEIQWKQAQKNGVKIVNQRYLRTSFEGDFIARLLVLKGNLEAHRHQNFFGALLLHHTLASTKYMSRWIEAKNQISK